MPDRDYEEKRALKLPTVGLSDARQGGWPAASTVLPVDGRRQIGADEDVDEIFGSLGLHELVSQQAADADPERLRPLIVSPSRSN